MFDFEKLEVYKKAKNINVEISEFLKSINVDVFLNNQLKRASLSIILNIAEGSGRSTKRDKKNFFIIARGSVFECTSIFDLLFTKKEIEIEKYNYFYNQLEEISKMLYGLIKTHE